ncbi:MAG: hypothetical protein DRI89_07350 [Bacteroidetes bacterium]|nr:MAG: hypothetical protein DRI89_07350 [Bacteroidota bacterium]
MKKTFLLVLMIGLLIAGCDGPKNKETAETINLEESISLQEDKVFNSNNNRLNKQDATILMNLYEKYADQNPDDSLSAEYLFRASDISMNLQKPMQTIQFFNRILTEYPDFKKAPVVLFLKAFVYEDQLRDYKNAKKYYELFLTKYPESEFADDAEVSLKNLGKSPEELILEFESKQ